MKRRSRGQAMVEFGIIVSVLLMLILGTLQFGFIYHAKTALNYAAFETARAGALNNARMWAMDLAFSRSLAPLYTTPYRTATAGATDCPKGTLSLAQIETRSQALNNGGAIPQLGHVYCGRALVKNLLATQRARILLINPHADSFTDHGITTQFGERYKYIPNDNLMYRAKRATGISRQSIQDANLIKVHVSLCYELFVPLVNRMIAGVVAFGPNFPNVPVIAAENQSFAEACSVTPFASGRYGIPIHAQAIMRMQSDPIDDGTFCSGYCPP